MASKWCSAMFLWYGLLWSVIEGFEDRGLEVKGSMAEAIAQISDTLRQFRNAVFHVSPKNQHDPRLFGLMQDPNNVARVCRISTGFGRIFMEEQAAQKAEREAQRLKRVNGKCLSASGAATTVAEQGPTPDRNGSMDVIRLLKEEDMVRAWVEAEREAPRHRADWRQMGLGSVPLSAAARRGALGTMRGFPDRFVFTGLPLPMEWHLARVTIEELGGFRYLNYPTFVALSEGTRLVRDGAANVERVEVEEDLNERVRQTEAGLAAGQVHEPVIAVTSPIEPAPILIEGNTRATAYLRYRRPDESIELIVGTADDLSGWEFV